MMKPALLHPEIQRIVKTSAARVPLLACPAVPQPRKQTNGHCWTSQQWHPWSYSLTSWARLASLLALVALLTLICGEPRMSLAEEAEPAPKVSTGPINWKLPTWGGKQFWVDQQMFHGWRIQRNVFTGHHRLLDEKNWRHAWGTLPECRAKLERIKTERELAPMQGKAVIVLHGLFRTRTTMNKMSRYLHDEGGYTTFNMTYPTTRGTVGDHAEALAQVIASLDGIEEIHFVAHSLGGLVIRRYLADQTDPAAGRRPDPRIRRIVMLGPPNQGAALARMLVPLDLTGKIAGQAAGEIAYNWKELAAGLATPDCEFGILAGGSGGKGGRNPLLPGDDDLVVTVASTKLAGACDFRVLPVWHTTMMNDPVVQVYTLRFLEKGYFETEEARQPLVAED